MICGRKKKIYTIENDIFSCPKLFNKENRINKTRLPSWLCPKPFYTDFKTHTVIKVIENTRICQLYRSTQRVTCTFAPTQCKQHIFLKTDARKSRSQWSLNCICTDSVTPRCVPKPNLGFLGFMHVTRFF